MTSERSPSSGASHSGTGAACRLGRDLWVRREEDGSYTVGLTSEAQARAGRIVHWRGPQVGTTYREGEPAVSIESEKWVGHLGVPASGMIVATNEGLYEDPAAINRDPYGGGWLYRLRAERPEELERAHTGPVDR